MRPLRLASGILLGTAALAAALAVAPAPAQADGSFRCGSRLVKDGETQDDVAHKCGSPDAVRTWTETETHAVYQGGQKIERTVPIEYAEWKYDFGRDRLIRYLLFVQGRLRSVTTGEYGGK